MNLTINDARQLVEACMVAYEHTADEAAIIADHLIDCELRGLSFGGLPRALSVLEHLREMPEPRRPIKLLQESPVSAALDGGEQVGYLVGRRATELALEKARAFGIAAVGANRTWYTGMFSYYLEMVTRAGYAGMIAGAGRPKVAPHGGTEGRFSTNPIAFGFPSTDTPVIWDIGTANVMVGEVTLRKRLGELLPEGMAFDHDGAPTCDPAEALKGAFTVWGGHKGSGLAMVVHLLAMMAGQAAAPANLRDCGFFILVVNPELFDPAGTFRQRVAEYADSMRATRPVNGGSPVRVPFDRSIVERSKRLAANSIEVPDLVYEGLRRAAASVAA